VSRGRPARPSAAIVVGAGVAGLSAACALARGGVRTTLLETCGEPGGLCRNVRLGGLTWSLALYSLRGAGPGGPLPGLLQELGIAESVRLRHTARAYRVLLGRKEFPFGTSDEEMLAAAAGFGRRGADALRPLLERIRRFDPVRDYAALRGATFAEAVADLALPPRLRAAFSAPLMISLGLPPERASAYFAFMKYRLILESGLSWPEGGADALVGALVARFLEDGGDLRFGERVVSVAVEPSGRKTVTCDSMERYAADQLVLACDATAALGWLTPHLEPRFLKKTRQLRPTLPAALLLLEGSSGTLARTGLDGFAHVVALADDDLAGAYSRLRGGDASASGLVAGLTSPHTWGGAAADGRVAFTAFFLAPENAREADAAKLAAWLRKAFGAAGAGLKPVGAIAPEVLRTMAMNRGGAFSGWEMGPERYGPARLPQALPVPGVWLAGHWTDPGPSVLNAMLSGRTAARRILDA
jgi:phytoene dehydrogenase-like protein